MGSSSESKRFGFFSQIKSTLLPFFRNPDEDDDAQKLKKNFEEVKGEPVDAEEMRFLEGLLNFTQTVAKQIMRSRMDIVALDIEMTYAEVVQVIGQNGFSRMPIYRSNVDAIEGILYIKDLFPFYEKGPDFNWQQLIRPCDFIPETKRIHELLKEFQQRHSQMAIVLDEYGGVSGLITMEDIIEEIVGEIRDEFDDEEKTFVRIDELTYLFEAKIPLVDFCKIVGFKIEFFDEIRGEAESLGGLMLEIQAGLPPKGSVLEYEGFRFGIEEADDKRILRIKVSLPVLSEENQND
jgi:CBS domain containing-hemolysin-like protein